MAHHAIANPKQFQTVFIRSRDILLECATATERNQLLNYGQMFARIEVLGQAFVDNFESIPNWRQLITRTPKTTRVLVVEPEKPQKTLESITAYRGSE